MTPYDVSPARPHELLPACRLLFGDGGADGSRERLLSAGAESGLLVARVGGRVCAAALAQSLPGALGVTCPPRGDSPEAEDAVAVAACEWLRARGVKVCQAFADRDEIDLMGPLERAGFRYVTQLVFMRRGAGAAKPNVGGPEVSGELLELSEPPLPAAVRDVLLATHEHTRDCPELNALRTPDEIAAGFEAAPDRWCRLVSCDSRRVGVVVSDLFDFGPEQRYAELSYLGVVPDARGRGIGGAALAFELAELTDAGFPTVNLSVDARNTPAVRLYTKCGFAEYERRGVWLATWPA